VLGQSARTNDDESTLLGVGLNNKFEFRGAETPDWSNIPTLKRIDDEEQPWTRMAQMIAIIAAMCFMIVSEDIPPALCRISSSGEFELQAPLDALLR